MTEELKLENARKFLGAGTPAGNSLIEVYLATGTLDGDAKISGEVRLANQAVELKDYLVSHYCQIIGSDLEHILIVFAEMYPPEDKATKPAKRRGNKEMNHGEKDR